MLEVAVAGGEEREEGLEAACDERVLIEILKVFFFRVFFFVVVDEK